MVTTTADIKRYRRFLNEEVDGLYIYQQLAEIEEDAQLKDVYHRLAETERRHLDLWQEQLRLAGQDDSVGRPSRRARFLMWVARKGGVDLVLPVIKAFENDATDMYAGDLIAEAAKLPEDEAKRVEKELQVNPVTVCGGCQGSGAASGSAPQACGECRGTGTIKHVVSTGFGQVDLEAGSLGHAVLPWSSEADDGVHDVFAG